MEQGGPQKLNDLATQLRSSSTKNRDHGLTAVITGATR